MTEIRLEEIETEATGKATSQAELPVILVTLLKGVIYLEGDQKLWKGLIRYQHKVRDYVGTIGLELILDEAEGYAFLRSSPHKEDDEEIEQIPRLVARRPLSFHVSLILALLRKRLAEFDAGGGETRLVLSLEEIVELVKIFLPAGTNESKLVNQIETHINKIIDLGFLRKLKPQFSSDSRYEVRRILKAFVDAQWLSDFDIRLEQYKQKLGESVGDSDDES
jgi:hypothetical protein